MFVVQDKETGLFYRNTGGGRGRRRQDGDWVADLQDVIPFRTMGAVRNVFMSLGSILYDFNSAKRNGLLAHECCKELKWSCYRGVTNKCEHYKAAEEARKQKARSKYTVFKVRLQLQAEQDL
jgi:hypothetical protein